MGKRADWKDVSITARVTKEEKEKIKKQAKKEGKSTSQYLTDAALAGMERRSSKDKKRAGILINSQNIFNDIFKLLQDESVPKELCEKILELAEEDNKLWQCL
ncbi:MAG: hypothetical protein K2O59_00855 [Lachnospiraceae bacterium]|nr:hypothetical protein [Lachnospiraceae bacterium]